VPIGWSPSNAARLRSASNTARSCSVIASCGQAEPKAMAATVEKTGSSDSSIGRIG
jgi:hypothetical protein